MPRFTHRWLEGDRDRTARLAAKVISASRL
jgi:hypothetical protein